MPNFFMSHLFNEQVKVNSLFINIAEAVNVVTKIIFIR